MKKTPKLDKLLAEITRKIEAIRKAKEARTDQLRSLIRKLDSLRFDWEDETSELLMKLEMSVNDLEENVDEMERGR